MRIISEKIYEDNIWGSFRGGYLRRIPKENFWVGYLRRKIVPSFWEKKNYVAFWILNESCNFFPPCWLLPFSVFSFYFQGSLYSGESIYLGVCLPVCLSIHLSFCLSVKVGCKKKRISNCRLKSLTYFINAALNPKCLILSYLQLWQVTVLQPL